MRADELEQIRESHDYLREILEETDGKDISKLDVETRNTRLEALNLYPYSLPEKFVAGPFETNRKERRRQAAEDRQKTITTMSRSRRRGLLKAIESSNARRDELRKAKTAAQITRISDHEPNKEQQAA